MENNNKFLIDTHIFIWWMEKNKLLSEDIYQLLTNPQNQVFLSVASIWEIIIKMGKKKLKTAVDIEKGIELSGFSLLNITLPHVLEVYQLPSHHNDPFDRMLIAQAKVENFIFITVDEKMKNYDIETL